MLGNSGRLVANTANLEMIANTLFLSDAFKLNLDETQPDTLKQWGQYIC